MKNEDPAYFDRRHRIAKRYGLPPFGRRYIVRVRLSNMKNLDTFYEKLQLLLGPDNVSLPKQIIGASATKRVFEIEVATPIALMDRHKILDIGRSLKTEVIPYTTYS